MAQPNFFVDHKKGEVNELKAHLRNPAIDKDPQRKRDVIKRVIAYMTLGIDVSRLFSEMIMATNTKDMVQKKMVYLYLCNYAEANAELAILAINTLRKDCNDEDPMVRGLALRMLSSLRLPNIVEYLQAPITSGLKDPSPYVRKTAVMGVLKLFHLSRNAVKETDMMDTLYNMIRDRDPQVAANALCALNEILTDEGGIPVNKPIAHHILNRLKEFNEWNQCLILEIVARYIPDDHNERYDIMNLLEDRLKHANSAVVLGATKVFMNLTLDMPEVHKQVFERLKSPLLTQMSGANYELSYTTLSHIRLLTSRMPEMFAEEYKQFFCRYNDATSVKMLKLDILTNIVTEKSMPDIISELSEYVSDVDASLARRSIHCIGEIAVKCPSGADQIIEQLLGFLDLSSDYVCAETVITMKNLLRKYPERYQDAIAAIAKAMPVIGEDQEAKAAVTWMIGEYGQHIPDGPYVLEPLVENFAEEPSSAVKLELLTATMKLFFKRAPEVQPILGQLLETAINDFSNTDVHDRALLYYRLLRYNVNEANSVVNGTKRAVTTFTEDVRTEEQDRVFNEFNSLSVIYGQPSDMFIIKSLHRDDTELDDDDDDDNDDHTGGGV
eukprot:GFYU01002235.1.p1 GENE.GFYU01002235.1~~GFYU01002235.1.p1  ORF type:complete len:611 (-),score=160.67 GFYU01002235.1:77-1909(-)